MPHEGMEAVLIDVLLPAVQGAVHPLGDVALHFLWNLCVQILPQYVSPLTSADAFLLARTGDATGIVR